MRGDRDGERGAFFRVGGGAEFVEKDERVCIGKTREAIEIDDVRGEGGELGLDGLRVADVGEECGEDGKAGGGCGNGKAGLGHHGEQRGGFEGDGFAAGVGAADDELAGSVVSSSVSGTIFPPVAAEVALKERMAGGSQAAGARA